MKTKHTFLAALGLGFATLTTTASAILPGGCYNVPKKNGSQEKGGHWDTNRCNPSSKGRDFCATRTSTTTRAVSYPATKKHTPLQLSSYCAPKKMVTPCKTSSTTYKVCPPVYSHASVKYCEPTRTKMASSVKYPAVYHKASTHKTCTPVRAHTATKKYCEPAHASKRVDYKVCTTTSTKKSTTCHQQDHGKGNGHQDRDHQGQGRGQDGKPRQGEGKGKRQ